MTIIRPVLTEKSTSEAKKGHYTFLVGRDMDKRKIKKAVEEIYDVHVTGVRTMNIRGGVRKNFRGKKVKIPARKKTMVSLKTEEKIDIFEEKPR